MCEEFEAVSFEIERARMLAIVAALENDQREVYDALWRAAYEDDRLRRDRVVGRFVERAEISAALGGEPHVESAPEIVRRAVAATALRHARRLQVLRNIHAPEIVLRATLANVERALSALDPSAPYPDEEMPPLVDDDAGRVHVHAWLDRVLEWSRDPATLRIDRIAVEVPTEVEADEMRPGIESVAFSMAPSRALWLPKSIVLPHLLDGGRTVVGEAGGPLTYELNGDRARVSFLYRDTGVDIAWGDRD